MKKKLLSLFTAVLMAASLLVVMPAASAGAVTSGDLEYYILDDDTGSIIGYTGSDAELTIPSEIDGKIVTSIGYEAFYNCSSLKSITIPDSVTSIGEYAFRDCTSLESVTIPDSITSIEEYAFSGTPFLDSQTTTVKYAGRVVAGCDSDATTAEIKDGTIAIAECAFEDCTSLESVTIPDSVTEIGYGAFYNTPFLNNQTTTVKYAGKFVIGCDEDATTAEIKDGTIAIVDCALLGCTSLESVTIPDSVTSIGGEAFRGTPFLNNQTTTVKYAGKFAINCDGDAITAEIKDGTKVIADYAFENSTSLASVTIPDSVTSIGEYAFADCTSLESVTIPSSVTEIGYHAFGYYNDAKEDGFTIYCYSGTAGEQYAIDNDFDYVLLEEPATEPTTEPTTEATTEPDDAESDFSNENIETKNSHSTGVKIIVLILIILIVATGFGIGFGVAVVIKKRTKM